MPEFTTEQIEQLEAKLDGSRVSTRNQSGRDLSYLEGWYVIAEANRIFGFGGWTNEIRNESPVVFPVQGQPNYTSSDRNGNPREGYSAAYTMTVRITVGDQFHDGVGSGSGIDYVSAATAIESAIKEAETDAIKRALIKWGNPFGLALYDKTQANVDHPAGQSAPRNSSNGKPGARNLASSAEKCPEHGLEWRPTSRGNNAHPIKDGDTLLGWCDEDEYKKAHFDHEAELLGGAK